MLVRNRPRLDTPRLRILNILIRAQAAPVCVCELVPELGLTQPTISYGEQTRPAELVGQTVATKEEAA